MPTVFVYRRPISACCVCHTCLGQGKPPSLSCQLASFMYYSRLSASLAFLLLSHEWNWSVRGGAQESKQASSVQHQVRRIARGVYLLIVNLGVAVHAYSRRN